MPTWLRLSLLTLLPLLGRSATAVSAAPPSAATQPVAAEVAPAVARFVDVGAAAALLAAGATVLDARARGFVWAHLPTAQPVDWLDYRDGWGRTGRLHPDPQAMAARLARLGVDARRPVLVYGAAAAGFGEEGRIAWLLLYLGHRQVHILDGGFAAWQAAGQEVARGPVLRSPPPGEFPPTLQAGLRAERAAVQRAVSAATAGAPILVDVRSQAEWHGATPYLEARGGHIPGARWLDWQRLLGADGALKPDAQLRRELAAIGLSGPAPSPPGEPPREIIVYCTGGVRSAFVLTVLHKLGYRHVRNYDGSFWEWSADLSLPVQTDIAP